MQMTALATNESGRCTCWMTTSYSSGEITGAPISGFVKVEFIRVISSNRFKREISANTDRKLFVDGGFGC